MKKLILVLTVALVSLSSFTSSKDILEIKKENPFTISEYQYNEDDGCMIRDCIILNGTTYCTEWRPCNNTPIPGDQF